MIPKGGLEISGYEEIYDDGIFRIRLPQELILKTWGEDDPVVFTVGDLPLEIEWTTAVFDKDQLKDLGVNSDTIDGVIRHFMPDLATDEPLKLIPMSNGFGMTSHYSIKDGECRSAHLLGMLTDEGGFIASTLDIIGVEEWDGDPRFAGLSHILKNSMRFAVCSLGQPRINSSEAWLYVDKIGVRFPKEIGGMAYQFATDYESTGPGEGVSLRYADEEGRWADIYVYDLREELIEPGPTSEIVVAQMEDSVALLEEFYAPTTPKALSKGVSSYGRHDTPFLDERFLISRDAPEEQSFMTAILLAAERGSFIKARITSLPGETQIENQCLSAFMNDLADIMN
jgi:hypothetical protein